MFLQGIFYFTLNMLIEYNFFISLKPTKNIEKLGLPGCAEEDDDVARERERILNKERWLKNKKGMSVAGKYRDSKHSTEGKRAR